MYPIPIFIPAHHEPERCPSCGKIEKKVEICTYCKYEYKEEPFTKKDYIYLWMVLIVIVIGGFIGSVNIFPDPVGGSTFSEYILGFLLGVVLTFVAILILGGFILLIQNSIKKFNE